MFHRNISVVKVQDKQNEELTLKLLCVELINKSVREVYPAHAKFQINQ